MARYWAIMLDNGLKRSPAFCSILVWSINSAYRVVPELVNSIMLQTFPAGTAHLTMSAF